MDFGTAVKTCFSKYADFNGRARRSELWWFVLFTFVVNAVLSFIPPQIGDSGSLWSNLFALAVLIPSLAVGARRLHDTDRSGWWQLLALIPIVGWIILIVWFAQDSHPGGNRFGANPKSGELLADPPYPQTYGQPGAYGQQPGQVPPPPPYEQS